MLPYNPSGDGSQGLRWHGSSVRDLVANRSNRQPWSRTRLAVVAVVGGAEVRRRWEAVVDQIGREDSALSKRGDGGSHMVDG